MRTSTPTEAPAALGALVRVQRRGSRTVVAELRSGGPLALRPLPDRGGWARVALVQSGAMLLAGDRVSLDVEVGQGARLDLAEIGGTVAHPVGDGDGIALDLRLTVAAGGALVLAEQPLVLAAGTALRRTTHLALGEGACCAHREALVLGRDGEAPGAGTVRLRVTRAGRPVVDDTLQTGDAGVLASPAVLGGARCLATAGLWGVPAPAVPWEPATMVLGEDDVLLRGLGTDAPSALAPVDAVWDAWRAAAGASPGW